MKLDLFQQTMNALEKKIIDISYKHKLSHISSCLEAVNVIDKIFNLKKDDEPFILSNGHAGLALYVVLETWYFKDAEKLALKHGTHPTRDKEDHIDCSTGSLGSGITIAVGMALADRTKNVYVMMSDGECAEGSVWEALRIASDQKLENLKIVILANGHTGYGKADTETLDLRLQYFYPTLVVRSNVFSFPGFLQGVRGHYQVLDEAMYKELQTL